MADPSLANVILVTNFDGTDEDTSYTPEIGSSLTFSGDAKLDDGKTLFSNTTLYLDGTGDYVTWGDQASLQFLHDKTEDWTIEGWFYRPSLTGSATLLSTRSTNCGILLRTLDDGALSFGIYKNAGSIASIGTDPGVFSADTWHYIKVTCDVSSFDSIVLRVDGVSEGTDYQDDPTGTLDNNHGLYIGRTASGSFEGEMRAGPIRITQGQALDDSDVPDDVFPSTEVVEARVSIPGPLGTPSILAAYDFSGLIADARSYYVMEIEGDPVLRVPISSWQATVQTDTSSFLQCVIPAADDYVDDIEDRLDTEQFIVYRTTFVDGVELKSELARALLETTSYAEGATKATLTLSGYDPAYETPDSPATRVLSGLRTVTTSSAGAVRIRCDIDWFLRPGDTAQTDDQTFTVDYINYYAPTTGDIYMDVGTRG